MWSLLALLGCQEYVLHEPPVVPPADPPGIPDGGEGGPPNWQDCQGGWLARYSNLTVEHPDVEPGDDPPVYVDPATLDWWDTVDFQKFEPALDYGQSWWPVDDGLAEDPAYFAVSWVAWLRAWDDTNLQFILGNSDDAWVHLDQNPIAERPGIQPYTDTIYAVDIESGQYPLWIRYAHRADDNGFRFRVIGGDVSICYPDFTEEAR